MIYVIYTSILGDCKDGQGQAYTMDKLTMDRHEQIYQGQCYRFNLNRLREIYPYTMMPCSDPEVAVEGSVGYHSLLIGPACPPSLDHTHSVHLLH